MKCKQCRKRIAIYTIPGVIGWKYVCSACVYAVVMGYAKEYDMPFEEAVQQAVDEGLDKLP